MVPVILANLCMKPRGTYRNASMTSKLSVISGLFSGDIVQGLWDKGFNLSEAPGPQHCLDVSHSLLGSSLSCLGTSCPLPMQEVGLPSSYSPAKEWCWKTEGRRGKSGKEVGAALRRQ